MTVISRPISVQFLSHNRKAQCASNPFYPDGIDVDLSHGAEFTCVAELPYPAECCGILVAKCRACGANGAITTAGRRDDPRSVRLACKNMRGQK